VPGSDAGIGGRISMGVDPLFVSIAVAGGVWLVSSSILKLATRRGSAVLALLPRTVEKVERTPVLEGFAKRVGETKVGARLRLHVDRSHPDLSFSDALTWGMATSIGGWLVGSFLFGPPISWLAGFAAPVVADRVKVRLSGRRIQRIEHQLPEALALQSSALRAGHSLVRSLQIVASQTKSPLGQELTRAARQIEVGSSFDVAVAELIARTPSRDLELWVTALTVHRVTGGDLAGALEALASQVRERGHVRAEVRALTAQGRLSGLVVAIAPIAFFLLLSVTSKEQMRILYTTPVGFFCLAAGAAMEVLGFLWIRSILKVKV